MGKVVNERFNGFFYALGRVDVHLFLCRIMKKLHFFRKLRTKCTNMNDILK